MCAFNLIFLGGYQLFPKLPNPAYDEWVYSLQVLGILGAGGTLVVLDDTVRCWSDRDRGWFSKVHAATLSIACLGFVGFALIWHLFDFSIG